MRRSVGRRTGSRRLAGWASACVERVTVVGCAGALAGWLAMVGCATGAHDATAPADDRDAVGSESGSHDAGTDTDEFPTFDAEAPDFGRHDVARPVEAGPGAQPAQLSLGHAHSCARLVDGTARCWGSNAAGELGDGSGAGRSWAAPVLGLTGVVEVAVQTDGRRSCARQATGAITCWGDLGEIADERCHLDSPSMTVGCSLAPLAFPSPAGIVDLAVGADTCARFADGTAGCLGAPDGPLGALVNVAEVVFTDGGACARLYDGTVRCWGDGALGQLGVESSETCNSALGTNACSTKPLVPAIDGVAQLAAGAAHVCALSTTGTVRCWGANMLGQLGYGAIDECSKFKYACGKRPGAVRGLSGVTQIAAGGNHTCALLGDGTVQCWGDNSDGALGSATSETCGGDARNPCSTRPQSIPGMANVAEVAVGLRHACARLADGEVRCWGWNAFGQLGDGTSESRSSPTTVKL